MDGFRPRFFELLTDDIGERKGENRRESKKKSTRVKY